MKKGKKKWLTLAAALLSGVVATASSGLLGPEAALVANGLLDALAPEVVAM